MQWVFIYRFTINTSTIICGIMPVLQYVQWPVPYGTLWRPSRWDAECTKHKVLYVATNELGLGENKNMEV